MATTTRQRPPAPSGSLTAVPGPARHSRAVLRDIEPGSTVECTTCGERVKFMAKVRPKQVICNVYVDGRWNRVEHYHAECYAAAGEPHGEVDTTPVPRRASRTAS